MARKSKSDGRIQATFRMKQTTDKQLEIYCFLTGKTKQSVFDQALSEFLIKNKKKIRDGITRILRRPLLP